MGVTVNLSNVITRKLTSGKSLYESILIELLLQDGSAVTQNYYSFYTELGALYYLDVIPESGDTNLNVYDSDLSLLASDGVCSILTIGSTNYLMVTSDEANLVIVRFSDQDDIIVKATFKFEIVDGELIYTSNYSHDPTFEIVNGNLEVTFEDGYEYNLEIIGNYLFEKESE